VLDDDHLIRAVRYVSLNPVRARLVARPRNGSGPACEPTFQGSTNGPSKSPVLADPHLKELLNVENGGRLQPTTPAETTGRPLGAPEFVTALESLLGRKIARRAPGRKTAIKAERPEQLELL